MSKRWLRAVLLVSLVCPSVLAQSPADIERAKASFKAGAMAYAAGEYLAAIQALEAAYALTPRPAIAFSMAQAERRQYFVSREREHLERAISLYRRYLEHVPSGGRRADALDALSQLEPLAAMSPNGRAPSAPPATPPPPAVRRTRLMITTEAPGARLALDGGAHGTSPLIREVEPGRHRVDVEAPGFFPETRELVAVAGELIPVTVPLRERPSMLTVWASSDAEIYLDGAFAGQGARVTLSLPSGVHRLAVAKRGYQVASQVVALERGKSRSVRVVLERTGARTAALGLIIGGGAGVSASLLLSALAVREENRAQEFLGQREQGNVSSSDLDAYRDAIEQRNRYRLATAVTFGSSVGLLATGFFLYVLEQPDQFELRRTELPPPTPNPGESRNRGARRLRVLPLLSADTAGAGVSARF